MKRNYTILKLSVPLIALVIIASLAGILKPSFYSREAFNWQIQSIGQDKIDLYIVTPCLILTSLWAFLGSKAGLAVWSGILLYIVYTFTIYCFDIHFNRMFLVYCFTLGLSFYSFLYYFFGQLTSKTPIQYNDKVPRKTTAWYFIAIALIFYFLWLSDIIPAIVADTEPKSIKDMGAFTNPVEVIDLALFIPGLCISAIFLLRKKQIGFLMAPVMFVFTILMDVTVAVLMFMLKAQGQEADLSLTIIFGVLALFSIVLLIMFLKNIEKPAAV